MRSINRHDKQETRYLAQQLALGDDAAIALLYRKYFHRLLYYGLQVSGNYQQNEVEDVIQDLFIWLAENHRQIATVKDFEAYLFQSLRRNLQQKYTARRRRRNSFQRYLIYQPTDTEKTYHSPEFLHIQQEEERHLKDLIRRQLEQLPDYQREVLYLRFFENRSYSEIASLLSVSHQVAYNYVSRGIKKLKAQFADLIISVILTLAALW